MNDDIASRITKDIDQFKNNVEKFSSKDQKAMRIVELSKMYASDAKSYLDIKDFYTAFSCISYAHGLLDALKELYSE